MNGMYLVHTDSLVVCMCTEMSVLRCGTVWPCNTFWGGYKWILLPLGGTLQYSCVHCALSMVAWICVIVRLRILATAICAVAACIGYACTCVSADTQYQAQGLSLLASCSPVVLHV